MSQGAVVTYRKRDDAWLAGRDAVAKAEADPIPHFPLKEAENKREFLSFEDVFPVTTVGPTNLSDEPNATESDGENTDARRGDRAKDWTTSAGGIQKPGGGDAADATLPSAKGGDKWVDGTYTADGGWLYKDEAPMIANAVTPQPAAIPMMVPATEAPPALDDFHAGRFSLTNATGNFLDIQKHGNHDQSDHGNDEGGSGYRPHKTPQKYSAVLMPDDSAKELTVPYNDKDDRFGDGSQATRTKSGHRPLYNIAEDISRAWSQQKGGVNYAAKPYIEAMADLEDIRDSYGADSARSVVSYLLSNASGFKGPDAQRLKGELKAIINKASLAKSLTPAF